MAAYASGQSASKASAENLSTGAFPFATFPQNKSAPGVGVAARQAAVVWSPPQAPSSNLVEKMRQDVRQTDWHQLCSDKKTKFLVNANWSADEQRCGLLQTLCAISNARRVLEIGACCGVATLAMAEVLPVDGEVVSIEIEPYLADFGKQYWARSSHGRKITSVVGSAAECLASQKIKGSSYDLVVIDADKDGMWNYYMAAKELLSPRGAIVLDTTPYKGQPPDRYVKFGITERWECNSGQGAIDDALAKLRAEDSVRMSSFAGVTVLYPRPRGNEPSKDA